MARRFILCRLSAPKYEDPDEDAGHVCYHPSSTVTGFKSSQSEWKTPDDRVGNFAELMSLLEGSKSSMMSELSRLYTLDEAWDHVDRVRCDNVPK